VSVPARPKARERYPDRSPPPRGRTSLIAWARFVIPLSVGAALALGAALGAQAPRSRFDVALPIGIEAKPIDSFLFSAPDQRRFGMVEFIGGIELTSSHPDFGGFSALRVDDDGEHFVSLSDKGRWLTGRIIYDRDVPMGIADAVMAPMLGPDGRTLASRGWYDTGSLAEHDGMFYVGIERVNRIVRFDFAKSGVLARAQAIPVPLGISRLPYNKGLEALAFAPAASKLAGALMAFSERGLDAAGNLKAFLLGGAAPGEFSVKRRDGFDISDAAVLPSGGGQPAGRAVDVVAAPNDKQQLEPILGKIDALPEAFGKAETLLADTGYFSAANVEACTTAGIEPLIAMGRQAHHPPLQERFAAPPPAPENPTPIAAMAHRLKTPEGRTLYALRKQTPEPVFGIIQAVLGFRQFSLRGLEKVRGEWSLVTMAWNMKRMFVLNPA
jgi:hypothetical protein